MFKEQKMSEGNSQVISCKKPAACPCLPCILEEAKSPLILMHDSLETKAEKEWLAWMYPVYQGAGIFRYKIAEPSNLNFDLYLEFTLW